MAVIKNPMTLIGSKPKLQEKPIEIDENGSYIIEPDSTYDGLSRVEIDVAVAGGGETYADVVDGSVVDFVMPPGKNAIAQYLFYGNTTLKTVNLKTVETVGQYAFYNCYYVTTFKAKFTGAINNYAFNNVTRVANLDFDKESVITSVGNSAFSGFGSSRSGTEYLEFDMRKSIFKTLPSSSFGGNASYKNKYMRLILPPTLATLEGSAFAYTTFSDFYFTSTIPPTLSATTVWSNSTDYRIFVPYGSANAYRTKTNFTAQVNYIKGYSAENTFEQGRALPQYNAEGYELTWYSDPECTIPADIVADSTAMYYCTVGTEAIEVFGIAVNEAIDCMVRITDGSRTYANGEGILEAAEVTVTVTPNAGLELFALFVNGEEAENGTTVIIDGNIRIEAAAYNGTDIPAFMTFGNNSWAKIKETFLAGRGSYYWKVGDTKAISLTNGVKMHVCIADLLSSRYPSGSYNGSSGLKKAGCTMTFVEVFSTTTAMFPAGENYGGYYSATTGKNAMDSCYKLLPKDLQEIIVYVNVKSGQGSASQIVNTLENVKLFPPCAYEIFGQDAGSLGSIEGTPQYAYYANGGAKAKVTPAGVARSWWTRSPQKNSTFNFVVVSSGGSAQNMSVSTASINLSPVFVI